MEADGTAEHFEDDAKIIASSRKRREPDDFGGDLERKEKRSRHVDAEHEVGASTRGHLKFQDTVGRKDKDYVTPPLEQANQADPSSWGLARLGGASSRRAARDAHEGGRQGTDVFVTARVRLHTDRLCYGWNLI